MAPIVEAIFLHSLSMWECYVRFSLIYTPSDFTEELVQSEHYQWTVRVYQIEYLIFAWTRSYHYFYHSFLGSSKEIFLLLLYTTSVTKIDVA